MTVTAPLSPDLADSPCSVAECLEVAQVMGHARVHVEPGIPLPPDFTFVTLGLPLCLDHAHLLSHGCHLEELSSGL